jgi:hypothetical protein
MCKNFTVSGFIKEKNLVEKHIEVFQACDKKSVTEFINIFEKYTILANKLKNVKKLVDVISADFNISEKNIKKLEADTWTTEFINFCSENKKDNDAYSFPEFSGSKLTLDKKFNVNCIKITDAIPDSIKLVNRNSHMVLAGIPKNKDAQLGVNLTFKALIIYNHNCKKWLVVPYRIRSETGGGVRCDSFALSATSDNIFHQYKTWIKGFEKYGKDIGILNMNYYDKTFADLPNLFRPPQISHVMENVKKIINSDLRIGGKTTKKKSRKKKSKKKKSKKKKSKKKKSKKKKL